MYRNDAHADDEMQSPLGFMFARPSIVHGASVKSWLTPDREVLYLSLPFAPSGTCCDAWTQSGQP